MLIIFHVVPASLFTQDLPTELEELHNSKLVTKVYITISLIRQQWPSEVLSIMDLDSCIFLLLSYEPACLCNAARLVLREPGVAETKF